MQVRKFEARSMKEALEMVKKEMGPDAIILGVRDNKKSFGLVGDMSIEITAAASDDTLKKKKFAESKLREEDKLKLQASSARMQRTYINKAVDNYHRDQQKEAPRQATRTPYIEIADEVDGMVAPSPASERIRGAAQRAWTAMQVHGEWVEPQPEPEAPAAKVKGNGISALYNRAAASMTPAAKPTAEPNMQVIAGLQDEIANLRQMIRNFQNVPQQMVNAPPVVAHPGADYGLGFDMSFMFQKLTQAGVAPEIAAEILTTAQTNMPALRIKNKALVDAWVAKYILDTTKIAADQRHTKVHFFVGPAGAGKTSMLVKLASHAVVNERKRIAILTTDTLKVGAVEQLRIYAQILNVPFGIIRQNSDWQALASQMGQFDQVFVDSPGLSLKSDDENMFLRNIMPPAGISSALHLVLEATAKDSDITEVGKRYKIYGFQDVIFTNLELSSQHGTIYNFMKRLETPLHSFGLGTRVPEDFEMATKERVLDLIFKLTSLKKAN